MSSEHIFVYNELIVPYVALALIGKPTKSGPCDPAEPAPMEVECDTVYYTVASAVYLERKSASFGLTRIRRGRRC